MSIHFKELLTCRGGIHIRRGGGQTPPRPPNETLCRLLLVSVGLPFARSNYTIIIVKMFSMYCRLLFLNFMKTMCIKRVVIGEELDRLVVEEVERHSVLKMYQANYV